MFLSVFDTAVCLRCCLSFVLFNSQVLLDFVGFAVESLEVHSRWSFFWIEYFVLKTVTSSVFYNKWIMPLLGTILPLCASTFLHWADTENMRIKKYYTWENFVDKHPEPMERIIHFIHELSSQWLKYLQPLENIWMDLNYIGRFIKLYLEKNSGGKSGLKLLGNKATNQCLIILISESNGIWLKTITCPNRKSSTHNPYKAGKSLRTNKCSVNK